MAFVLLGDASDETRLLTHPSGFSIAIPGHPSLVDQIPPAPPAYDAIVTLGDQRMQLGVRFDAVSTTTDLAALTLTLAAAYGKGRGNADPNVRKLGSKITPAGASSATSTYPLEGGELESLFVIVRPTAAQTLAVLYLTIRYTTSDITPIRWASFRSAMLSTLRWDSSTSPTSGAATSVPALWPTDSAFAKPGVTMRFTDAAWAIAQAKAARLPTLDDAVMTALVQRLIELSVTDDPPRHPQVPYALGMITQQLAMIAPTAAVEPLVENIDDIKTTHDLRAWCWQNIWALGNRPST